MKGEGGSSHCLSQPLHRLSVCIWTQGSHVLNFLESPWKVLRFFTWKSVWTLWTWTKEIQLCNPEPAKGMNESLVFLYLFTNIVSIVFVGSSPPKQGGRATFWECSEDHWLWSCSWDCQHNKDECCWNICLDGAWSHTWKLFLKRKWCVEVSGIDVLTLSLPSS